NTALSVNGETGDCFRTSVRVRPPPDVIPNAQYDAGARASAGDSRDWGVRQGCPDKIGHPAGTALSEPDRARVPNVTCNNRGWQAHIATSIGLTIEYGAH